LRILVDADACPVKDIIIKIAGEKGIPVIMVMDTSHPWQYGDVTVITVDKERDSADIAMINLAQKNDVVVTQDYGVAALALGKGLRALNQNGLVFDSSNMDKLLFERHLAQKVRRGGGRTKNQKKRSREDDERFERNFRHVLDESFNNENGELL
jgi:uncharacterized protein YaiI (UPF0178 family)